MFKFPNFYDGTYAKTEIDEELSSYTNAFISALRETIENENVSTDYIIGYLDGMKVALSSDDCIGIKGCIEGTKEGLRYRENIKLPIKENSDFDNTMNLFNNEETDSSTETNEIQNVTESE